MRDEHDDYDDYEDDLPEARPVTRATFPPLVIAAGAIWIGYGAVMILNLLVLLAVTGLLAANTQQPRDAGAVVGGAVCVGGIVALIAAAFLHVGIQSVRGTANDTLGNGIGSIGLAVFQFLGGAAQALTGNPIAGGVHVVGGLGLLVAGILALIGRGQYRDWREAERGRAKRARKRAREDRD